MRTVCICGSNRFTKEAQQFGKRLEELGVVVYMPHFYRETGGKWDEVKEFDKQFVALGLTLDHFAKIRKADVVFIYNKDGYSGNSTTLEIGYATAFDKPIYALSDADDEICRHVLFKDVVPSPEELVKYL